MVYLWIALGSAVGGAARYWCYGVMARMLGETFPWGTLAVNVIGGSFIAVFAPLPGPEGRWLAPSSLRMVVIAGAVGAVATIFSCVLESRYLARQRQRCNAA